MRKIPTSERACHLLQTLTKTTVNGREWLRNPTAFFVVGFCSLFWPWPWAQKKRLCTVLDFPTLILASLFAPLMFAELPNQSPLLTMLKHCCLFNFLPHSFPDFLSSDSLLLKSRSSQHAFQSHNDPKNKGGWTKQLLHASALHCCRSPWVRVNNSPIFLSRRFHRPIYYPRVYFFSRLPIPLMLDDDWLGNFTTKPRIRKSNL